VSGTRVRPLLAVARALVFTLLTVVLSSGSHVLLTDAPLPWPTILAAGAASFALALLLGRRERGYAAIAALLIPLELALDTLFTDGQATCYRATDGGPVLGPWHSVNTFVFCGGTAAHTASVPAAAAWLPWLVLAAHLLIGLAAAWWLRRGEAAAFALLRATGAAVQCAAAPLRRALRLLLAVLADPASRPLPPRRPLPRTDAPAAPLLRHTLARRGPPKVPCTAC
jgi:hypothetical protein